MLAVAWAVPKMSKWIQVDTKLYLFLWFGVLFPNNCNYEFKSMLFFIESSTSIISTQNNYSLSEGSVKFQLSMFDLSWLLTF